MTKVLMSVWLGHPSGPAMEEGPARNDRNSLAAETIRSCNISELLPRVQAIQDGTNAEFDKCLRNIALLADKAKIAQLHYFSCISGSLTQFGLAGKLGYVSSSNQSVLAWKTL